MLISGLVSGNVTDSFPMEFVSNTFTGPILRSTRKGRGNVKLEKYIFF